jgi:hypothetical protein
MAAMLCVERPPPRTLGDDLESFALVLLWLVGRYSANNFPPVERAMFLQRSDNLYGAPIPTCFVLAGPSSPRRSQGPTQRRINFEEWKGFRDPDVAPLFQKEGRGRESLLVRSTN